MKVIFAVLPILSLHANEFSVYGSRKMGERKGVVGGEGASDLGRVESEVT